MWTKAGYEIPGLSKRDIKKLNDVVNKDPEINLFNEAALLISKQDKWIEPSAYWDSESLISDLNNLTNKVGRRYFNNSSISALNTLQSSASPIGPAYFFHGLSADQAAGSSNVYTIT